MSFQLGSFNAASVSGLKAILQEWPMLPPEVHLDSLAAGDGALFYRARLTQKEWVFRLELTGSDIDDVMTKADQISGAINPKRYGLQTFKPNAGGAWEWSGVASSPVRWDRDDVLWFSDQGICRLHGEVTILTPDPYGYIQGDNVTISSAGDLVLTGQGNDTFYPTVLFSGVLNSAQSVNVGGTIVTGPLTSAQQMVLDFQNLDFYIRLTATPTTKVRNVADRITALNRLEGSGSLTVPVSVSAGTFTQAIGSVRSRRI